MALDATSYLNAGGFTAHSVAMIIAAAKHQKQKGQAGLLCANKESVMQYQLHPHSQTHQPSCDPPSQPYPSTSPAVQS